MKRLASLFILCLLWVSASCYATITPAEQAELMEIILELEKINNEQKTTLNEQQTTLDHQEQTIDEQQTIIENLQRDATEQKALLKEQKKSYRITTLLSSLVAAFLSFLLGALVC